MNSQDTVLPMHLWPLLNLIVWTGKKSIFLVLFVVVLRIFGILAETFNALMVAYAERWDVGIYIAL